MAPSSDPIRAESGNTAWLEAVDRVLVALPDGNEGREVQRWMVAEGHACDCSVDVGAAYRTASRDGFSLMIAGGACEDVLAAVRETATEVAVLLLIDLADRRSALRAVGLGAAGYVIRPLERNDVVRAVSDALERRRLRVLSHRTNELVESRLRLRVAEFHHREQEMAVRLVRALELRGIETATHARRVGRASELLAIALGQSVGKAETIRTAASMHDVGKLGIPDSILVKVAPLMPEEEALVRKHTEIGARILGHSHDPLLQTAERIALRHHEAWDGSGYPDGIAGDQIPIEARIAAVADAWDELCCVRDAREATVLSSIQAGRGSAFDPAVVDAFVGLAREFTVIRQAHPDVPAA